MKKEIVLLVLLLVMLQGCGVFDHRRQQGAVAECEGAVLTYSEIDALTADLSPEDSAIVADRFIRQWATNLLLWEKAKGMEDKKIERLVEDYKRSLCQFEWEARQVAKKMSKEVVDSVVLQFYEKNKRLFVVNSAIVKGVFLVVPKDAPHLEKLRQAIKDPQKKENIEAIEKFAYQYAKSYELFLDEWTNVEQIAARMPDATDALVRQLKQTTRIESKDSLNIYILQATQVHTAGDYKPLDYVKEEIKDMILSQRQVEFVQELREEVYNKAIEIGKLKRYEK